MVVQIQELQKFAKSFEMRNVKTTVPISTTKETNKAKSTSTSATSDSGVTKEQIRMGLENELEDINKRLSNYSKAKKKSELKPENELKLFEKKLVLLMKLKQWKEVTDEGYKILGKKGPNVNIYKCILVSLCRLGKFEDDVVELLDHWKQATPKCTQMVETKRKMEGYLNAIRSGMNANVLLQNVEDVLGLNAELILSDTSDVEPSWKHRPPPQRHNTFSLCPRMSSGSECIYGDDCLLAHSKEELKEWQNRVQGRASVDNGKKVSVKGGGDGASVSNSTTSQSAKAVSPIVKERIPAMYRLLPPACMYYLVSLIKKVKETSDIKKVFVDSLPDVKIKYTTALDAKKVFANGSRISHQWSFMVASRHPLATVTLYNDMNRECFAITGAFFFNAKRQPLNLIDIHPNNKIQKGIQVLNTFIRPDVFLPFNGGWPEWCCYQINVAFQTTSNELQFYEQSLVFDFKTDPKVVKRLSVVIEAPNLVIGSKNPVTPQEVQEEKPSNNNVFDDSDPETVSDSDSDEDNSEKEVPQVVENSNNNIDTMNVCQEEPKKPTLSNLTSSETNSDNLLTRSKLVESEANILLQQWISQRKKDLDDSSNMDSLNQSLKQGNYVLWMNRFLTLEAKAQHNLLQKLSSTIGIKLFNSSLNTNGNVTSIGLFGELQLSRDISKDCKTGRLILSSCQSLTIRKVNSSSRTYVCRIVNKKVSSLVILIGHEAVEELHLRDGVTEKFEVSLVLDRTYLDLINNALQGLREHHFQLLFPEFLVKNSSVIPNVEGIDYLQDKDVILNTKQRDAFSAIMINSLFQSRQNIERCPPVVLTGSHGCGKSYIIALSVMSIVGSRSVLKQPKRVLICTKSDDAADRFILEYFHPWKVKQTFSNNGPDPLRVFRAVQPVQDVSEIVKMHSLMAPDGKIFRCPTLDEVLAHQVIIVTLTTCFHLMQLGLPEDAFSHIFIDEAESMLEVESLCPISLAGKETKVVISGDPELLDPELFVTNVSTKMTQVSMLERLDDAYPLSHPFRIRLEETYCSNKEIVQFISTEFYSSSVRCTLTHSPHPNCFPLSFSCVFGGGEVQPDHGEGYYNMEEVYEIRDRIIDLVKSWPSCWGSPKEKSIAVFTSYADQAHALRVRLKLEGLSFVDVETLSNVIAKEYRVVFVSLVRTFQLQNSVNLSDVKETHTDTGLFTNRKAIYTAISRAKSLVIVVGDLISLWNNNGPCRNVWQAYLNTCKQNGSIIGYQNTAFLSGTLLTKPKELPAVTEAPVTSMPRNIPSTLNISTGDIKSNTEHPTAPSFTSNFSSLSQNNPRGSTVTGNVSDIQNNDGPSSAVLNAKRPTNFMPELVAASTPDDCLSNLSSIWNSPISPIAPMSVGVNSNNTSVSSHASIWDYNAAPSSNRSKTNLENLADPKSIWGTDLNISNPPTHSATPPGLLNISFDNKITSPYRNPFDLPDVRLLADAVLSQPPSTLQSAQASSAVSNVTSYRNELQYQLPSSSSFLFGSGRNPSPTYNGVIGNPIAGNGISSNSCWPDNANNIRPIALPTPLTHSGYSQATHNGITDTTDPHGNYYGSRRHGYIPPPRMLKTHRPPAPPAAAFDNFNLGFTKEPSKDFDFFRELDLQPEKDRKSSTSSSDSSGSFRESHDLGQGNDDPNFSLDSTDFPHLSDRNDNWIEVKNSKRSKSPAAVKQQQQQKKKGKKSKPTGSGGVGIPETKSEPSVEQKIESLKEMGFEKKLAIKALQACEKDLHRAVEWLIQYAPTKKE